MMCYSYCIHCRSEEFKLLCHWLELFYDFVVTYDIIKCDCCGYYKHANFQYYTYEEYKLLNN